MGFGRSRCWRCSCSTPACWTAGFIGVDVFFVISGFLITALAMIEIEREGRLGLGAFWARRARRLLPALMLVCAAVLVYSIAEGGAALRRVGGDITATILYVANWAQIGDGRDYFAAYDAPPLLQHAWSLAVEEQYYLAWPLILTGVVFGVRRRPEWLRPAVAAVAAAAALASVGVSSVVALAGRRTQPAVPRHRHPRRRVGGRFDRRLLPAARAT